MTVLDSHTIRGHPISNPLDRPRLMGPAARVLLRALSRALHSRLVGCSTAALGKVGERDSDALEEDVTVEAPSHE